jgi:hypothetical protein
LILHDQPGSPGGTGLRGHARVAVPVRSWRGGRHFAIVSPGRDHGEPRAVPGGCPGGRPTLPATPRRLPETAPRGSRRTAQPALAASASTVRHRDEREVKR